MQASYLSFWEYETFLKNIDLTIIGSGIVGLTSAYLYKQKFPEKRVVVLESGVLPHGATTRNAGFACFGSISEILDDLKETDEESCFKLVKERHDGLLALLDLHGKSSIGYVQSGGFEIFFDNDEALFEECFSKMDYINKALKKYAGFDTNVFECIDLPKHWRIKAYPKIFFNPFEGQIHSGMLMQHLLKLCNKSGILILNGIKATTIEVNNNHVTIEANPFDLKTSFVLVCNNGFASELLPELQVIPARGQVLVTSPIRDLNWEGTFHHYKGYDYFRNIGDRILIGGGRHIDLKNEYTSTMEITPVITDYLISVLKNHLIPEKEFTIEYSWAGIMGKGQSKQPIIKKIDDRVGVAVRMGGMGVAIGTNVARQAVELFTSQ
ncbi:MAG: FAD-binding oxidoreductase [Flavobacteriales bacterium]|nr:FAD-binding oxidoreductase [Flavobacteriales bacterium]